MAGNPGIAEAGKNTRFPKGSQPPGGGRRKSKIKEFAQSMDLSNEDVGRAINQIIDMTEDEMAKFFTDKTRPVILRGFAGAVMAEIKKHGLQNIMVLLERSFGKAKEIVEKSGTQTIIHIGKEFDKL